MNNQDDISNFDQWVHPVTDGYFYLQFISSTLWIITQPAFVVILQ